MPGVIDRFQALFRPRAEQVTAVTTVLPPVRPSALARLLATENDRRTVVDECRQMYETDPRAFGVIRALATDATRGGFDLVVEGSRAAEAQTIAEEMLERIEFRRLVTTWVAQTIRDGDSFLELGATAVGDLVEATRKPTLEMARLSDEFDRFEDPARAFVWSDVLWNGWIPGHGIPPGAVTFAEWQMLHARYNHDSGSRYGRPMFAAARSQYKRMREGELDIAIRRKTRAGMKYLHSLKDASNAELEAYRVRNQAALNDPFAAVADFFANRDATITAVQGDANLSEIEDVLHHIRTWWIVSPVPMSLLGYGQDLNRDVLDEQKQQYDLAKEELSGWITEQFVNPLLERQWLLRGIWPAGLTWSVEWMSKQALRTEGLAQLAQAVAALRATGLLSDETLLRLISKFVPDFDVANELAALAAMQQDEALRVAANAEPPVPDSQQEEPN